MAGAAEPILHARRTHGRRRTSDPSRRPRNTAMGLTSARPALPFSVSLRGRRNTHGRTNAGSVSPVPPLWTSCNRTPVQGVSPPDPPNPALLGPIPGPLPWSHRPGESMAVHMDGITARELFQARQSLTYDDIIILPRHIDFGVNDVSLKTRLTRDIELSAPI